MSEPATAAQARGESYPLTVARNVGLGLGVGFSVLGPIVLLAGPLLFRMHVLPIDAATAGIEHLAQQVFMLGLVGSVVLLVVSFITRRQRGVILAVVGLIASGYGVGHLYSQGELRKSLPPIWDVQTDWSRPVPFSARLMSERGAAGAAPVRDDGVVTTEAGPWANKSFAEAQKAIYELSPLSVRASVKDATTSTAKAVERLGWTLVSSDPATGVVEATSRTFWYGFVSDVAVRITSEGEGARLDVRSTSRDAMNDLGSNTAQVEALVNEVALELR